jgi:hypothetical protein
MVIMCADYLEKTNSNRKSEFNRGTNLPSSGTSRALKLGECFSKCGTN